MESPNSSSFWLCVCRWGFVSLQNLVSKRKESWRPLFHLLISTSHTQFCCWTRVRVQDSCCVFLLPSSSNCCIIFEKERAEGEEEEGEDDDESRAGLESHSQLFQRISFNENEGSWLEICESLVFSLFLEQQLLLLLFLLLLPSCPQD